MCCESLVRRVDIFDEKTGNLVHPLFITRPEKRILLVVISGDKGFAGAFNANILKTAYQFIEGNPDKEIDIEAVGRRGATRCAGATRWPAMKSNLRVRKGTGRLESGGRLWK